MEVSITSFDTRKRPIHYMRKFREERGAITILTVTLIAIMFMLGVFLFDIMVFFRTKGEAQSAADAASKAAGLELTPLFGVGNDPRGAASRFAKLNHAEMVDFQTGSYRGMPTVTVKVRKHVRTLFLPPGKGGFYLTATSKTYLDLNPK